MAGWLSRKIKKIKKRSTNQKIDFSENHRFLLKKMGEAACAEKFYAISTFDSTQKLGFGIVVLVKIWKDKNTVIKSKISKGDKTCVKNAIGH